MIDKATTSVDQCPECQGDVQVVKGAVLGRLVTCPHCQAGLQVVSISPFHLDWFDVEIESDKDEGSAVRQATTAQKLTVGAPTQANKAAAGGSAACPECQAPVRAKRIKKLGQELRCRECDKLLTVISMKPLQLEWLAEEPALRPFEMKARKKPVSLRLKNHKSEFDDQDDRDYGDN